MVFCWEAGAELEEVYFTLFHLFCYCDNSFSGVSHQNAQSILLVMVVLLHVNKDSVNRGMAGYTTTIAHRQGHNIAHLEPVCVYFLDVCQQEVEMSVKCCHWDGCIFSVDYTCRSL